MQHVDLLWFEQRRAVKLLPAGLVDYRVHAALWCQTHNQGSFFIFHIYVEASKSRQEHHLIQSTIKHLHVLRLTLGVQTFRTAVFSVNVFSRVHVSGFNPQCFRFTGISLSCDERKPTPAEHLAAQS